MWWWWWWWWWTSRESTTAEGCWYIFRFPLPRSTKHPRLYLEAKLLGERQHVQITNRRNRGLAL